MYAAIFILFLAKLPSLMLKTSQLQFKGSLHCYLMATAKILLYTIYEIKFKLSFYVKFLTDLQKNLKNCFFVNPIKLFTAVIY